MFRHISPFFEKFKKLTPPDEALRSHVKKIIEEDIGVVLEKKDVKITYNTVFITTEPAVKNEIFLNKNTLLKKINTLSSQKKIRDIR